MVLTNNWIKLTRIKFLILFVAAILIIPPFLLPSQTHAQGKKLFKTPSDSEGPFYPKFRQQDDDNDLIHVAGHDHIAKGDILFLTGTVTNPEGKPYPNAVVEIWQTDSQGRYNTKESEKTGDLDRGFQYHGKTSTEQDGAFSFTTLVPGTYNPRPPHIHFKVWIDNTVRLTSQIYFRNKGGKIVEKFAQHVAPNLQTIDLVEKKAGEYEAFFQIVL